MELKRIIVQLPDNAKLIEAEFEPSQKRTLNDGQQFYAAFWDELLSEIELDDTSQELANKTICENISFPLPPSRQIAWVSAYFSNSTGSVGVYLRLSQSLGDRLFEYFEQIRDEVDQDLGLGVDWRTKADGLHSIGHSINIPDVFDAQYRDQIKVYFKETINQFINTFRHRLERISEELS